MRVEFTGARDRAYFRRLIAERSRRRRYLLLTWCALFACAAVLGWSSDDGRGQLSGVFSLYAAAALAGRTVGAVRRAVATLPATSFAPRTYVVSDEELATRAEFASASVDWRVFRRAVERPYAYLLYDDGQGVIDLPRAALSAVQDREIRALLVARGLLRDEQRARRSGPPTAAAVAGGEPPSESGRMGA